MNRSTAKSWAYAILLALPLLPLLGFILHGPPVVVFSIGATSFITGAMLVVSLVAMSNIPPAGASPAATRCHFTIRDLLCLTTVMFGMAMFLVSGFRCEAAERASRSRPLPPATFRQFVWELESGLVCMTIGSLLWIRSARKRPPESISRDTPLPFATYRS